MPTTTSLHCGQSWSARIRTLVARTGLLAMALSLAACTGPAGPAATSTAPTGTGAAPGLTTGVTATTAAATHPATRPAPTATRTTTTARPAPAPAHFGTRPPGAALPTGAQCATWVRATPYRENKRVNTAANRVTGHHIGAAFYTGDDARANTRIGVRVDGQFTGTTHQILRWAACKWGVDEDLVYAQAAIESWWRQTTLGDWTTDASRCAPGRGLGVDGTAGQCPESFGILQNRYPYEQTGWPGIAASTALNADLAYATFRVCFEGYETWLGTVEHGQPYTAGDTWGCVGRWFSGRWHISAGDGYVARVKDYLSRRIWETPDFQEA